MALRDELRDTYQQAAKEVEQKTRTFWERHKAKAARKLKEVDEGKITLAEYKEWLAGQVFTGERWTEKLDDITQVYVDADKKAREIIGGTTKNVFVRYANSTAKDVESHIKGGFSFDIYDKHTVERLLKDNPDLLPKWKINEPKDYRWNQQRVKNAVTQGIIQGESIDDIGKRLTKGLSAKNADHMVMFARTAVTGAQNAGRMERLHEAQGLGIKVRKKWLAMLDNRTRDVHKKELNGKEADIDEPFHSSLGDIMFPGDPTADPANVYNCRCTLTYVFPKYQQTVKPQEETGEPEATIQHQPFTPAKTIEEAEQYARRFLQSEKYGEISYKGIDLEYANTCNKVLTDVFGNFDVEWKLGKVAPMNAREKIFKGIIDSAEASYQWSGDGRLFINPRFYKDKKAFAAHKSEIDKLMAIVTKDGQVLLDSGAYTGAKREYVETLLKTGRQCVSQSYDFVEGTFVHEAGHMMDDKAFRRIMKEMDSPLAKGSGLAESKAKFAKNISGYATATQQEYIAESFAAWWYGETDILDPELVKVFERAKKHG